MKRCLSLALLLALALTILVGCNMPIKTQKIEIDLVKLFYPEYAEQLQIIHPENMPENIYTLYQSVGGEGYLALFKVKTAEATSVFAVAIASYVYTVVEVREVFYKDSERYEDGFLSSLVGKDEAGLQALSTSDSPASGMKTALKATILEIISYLKSIGPAEDAPAFVEELLEKLPEDVDINSVEKAPVTADKPECIMDLYQTAENTGYAALIKVSGASQKENIAALVINGETLEIVGIRMLINSDAADLSSAFISAFTNKTGTTITDVEATTETQELFKTAITDTLTYVESLTTVE